MFEPINWSEQMPGKIFVDQEYTITVSGHLSWIDTDTGATHMFNTVNQCIDTLTVELLLNQQQLFTQSVTDIFDFSVKLTDTKEICDNKLAIQVSGLSCFERTNSLAPALFIDKFAVEDVSLIKALGYLENNVVANNLGYPTTFVGQDCCQTLMYYTPIYHFLVKHHQLIDHRQQ